MDPSAEEKVAYFELLRSLGGASPHDDGHGDNDELDALELRDRQLRFRFFRPPPPFPPAPADGRHVGRPAPEEQRGAAPGPVIANTQPGPAARPLPSAGPADDSFADETVVPDSARPAPRSRRGRGHSTPAPAARRRLAAADAREQSPSLHPGARKRKRGGAAAGAPRLRPAEEQVFSGLAFFYVPNNDIAPARRLRIGKAREYGAAWTRSYAGATHIVVDKNLDYADVAKVVPVAALARGGPKLVNEDYPIDCIQFRSLLDHGQKKYRVAGQPAVAGDDAVSGPPQAPESPDDGKRRDPAPPPPGTPQRSDEPPSQASVVDATPLPAGPQPRSTGATARPRRESPGGAEDELSGFISMMQEFRHLPLDNDDDELAGSEPERAETREDEDDVAASESESESARDGGGRKKAQAKSRRKGGRFEDRFACHHAGEQAALAENANARTVEVLQSMADFYERVGDEWRTLGYRKAITTLKRQRVRIRSEEEAARLPHIGRRIAQKIEEIVTTDRLRRLEYAREEATDGALQLFLQVYGVGSRQARQWVAQGYRSLDELRKGGVRLTASQAIGVEHFDDLQQAIPRREVEALGAVVRRAAARLDPAVELIVGGSYRRGAESSRDIDLIVTRAGTRSAAELRPFLDALVGRLEADGFLVARLASSSSRTAAGGSIWHGCCVLPEAEGRHGQGHADGGGRAAAVWRRIDFLLVPETARGGALLYFTGNDIFNRSMRLLAAKKGYRLNQRGLYRDPLRGTAAGRDTASEADLVEGRDERRIFEVLGVRWREPHERWC